MKRLAAIAALTMMLGCVPLAWSLVANYIATVRFLQASGVSYELQLGFFTLLLLVPAAFAATVAYALVKRHDRAALLAAAFAFMSLCSFLVVQGAARGG